MFSIRKRNKIQVIYAIEGYASHPTAVPDNFHELTSKEVIMKYSMAAMTALSTTGSIDGVSKNIGYNPNDWYGIPQIQSIDDIKKWMRIVGLNIQELEDDALFTFIETSIKHAQHYLRGKGYYLPTILKQDIHGSSKEMIRLMGTMNKYKKEGDTRSSTIFLKVVRAQFKVLTSKDATGRSVYNVATGEIEGRDKQLKIDIMKFFNKADDFFYATGAARFGPESTIAHGRARRDGVDVAFNAVVDFKTLESQVLKTISQNTYDAAEAQKDKNRMQFEVSTKKDMLLISLVMIRSGLLKKGIEWQQKGSLFSKDMKEWDEFQSSYVQSMADGNMKDLLLSLPTEKVKGNTAERQEIQITSKDPSFEIQIVLVGNTNESGYNANPYYKMKADIDEEIILRGGYITKDRILKHIIRRIPDLIKFGQDPKEKTAEKIFEHFVTTEKKIIPLYDEDYAPKKGQSPSHKHVIFYTNKDFTSRGVKVYQSTLPFKIWHESTGIFSPLNIPSFPSSP